jgi:uncharacterized protein
MKNRKIIVMVFVVGIIGITVYNFQGTSTGTKGYQQQILDSRADKDKIFKSSEDSPLTVEQKEIFKSLSYFPVMEKYRIMGEFRRNSNQILIKMAVTDGTQREYYIFGNVHFHLDGKELDLTVYKSAKEETEYLFIPFYDKTSAELTYGGGRYLEPTLLNNTTLEMDFNKAYNPYCVYNYTYRCAIPPRENTLDVSILAGEKMPDFVH